MQFILHNHPDRIGDTDFIRDRGRQAVTSLLSAVAVWTPYFDVFFSSLHPFLWGG